METRRRPGWAGPLLLTLLSTVPWQLHAEWQWVNPRPQGNILADVTWGNNQFVAVGNAGTAMTSPDGNQWTVQETKTNQWFEEVIWTGSRYVAVGNNGTIAISPDGANWTRIPQRSVTNHLYGLTQGADRLLAVGSNSTIIHSTNGGNTWVREPLPDTFPRAWLNDVVWDGQNQRYVAVGEKGHIVYGTPGNWSSTLAPDSFRNPSGNLPSLEGITTNGSTLIIVGEGANVLRSTNGGLDWTSHPVGSSQLNSVIWNGSRFVAVGKSGSVYTSPDGLQWTRSREPSSTADLEGIAVSGGGTYVAVGEGGILWRSSDANQWNQPTGLAGQERVQLESVAFNGGEIIAVGQNGSILLAAAGSNVERISHGGGSSRLNDVIRTADGYTAVGDGGTILTSPDGTNWQVVTVGSGALEAVAQGNNRYVAVGRGVGAYNDTGEWIPTNIPGGTTLYDVTFRGGQFIAVGAGGAVATSADGRSWSVQGAGVTQDLQGIAAAESLFVAVGADGTMLTSPNGQQWSSVTPFTREDLWAVDWTGSHFYAVGSNGTILVSADGRSWQSQQATGNSLLGVAGEGNDVVVVGTSGTILKSSCPCATDDSATTTRNTTANIRVLDNDIGTALSIQSVSASSAGGSVAHDGQTVTYSPPPDFVGTDSFEYTVTGQGGGTSVGTVTVRVDRGQNNVNGSSGGGGGGGSLEGLALLSLALLALRQRR